MLTPDKGRQRTLLRWLPTSVPLAKQDALLTSKEGKTFMNRLSRTGFHGHKGRVRLQRSAIDDGAAIGVQGLAADEGGIQ